jgi:hypothetical protein
MRTEEASSASDESPHLKPTDDMKYMASAAARRRCSFVD